MFPENPTRYGSGQPRPGNSWRMTVLLSLMLLHQLPSGALAADSDEPELQKIVDGLASTIGIGLNGTEMSTDVDSSSTVASSAQVTLAQNITSSALVTSTPDATLPTLTTLTTLTTSSAPATTGLATSASVNLTLTTSLPAANLTTTMRTATTATSSATTSAQSPQTTTSPVNGTTTTTGLSRGVFAHFIVGNTYNYTVNSWYNDVVLAASKGIDAFALNIGVDSWEPGQVANAYTAAAKFNAIVTNKNTPFKLFFSFDMSSFPCSATGDAAAIQTYIGTYANHTSTFIYAPPSGRNGAGQGRMLVSTFAGEGCRFGTGSLNDAWTSAVRAPGMPAVWFIPSFFVDPATFPNLPVIDGAFQWNSAWPLGNYNISFAPDQSYISNLGTRSYMAGVSPWFFTHYGVNTYNKNWIYRMDDWTFAQRWEMLVQNRATVPLVEVATWNDYGESHYVGPIEGIQPMSQAWVNGFDHQGWLDLMNYYITAYKTGKYPSITKDRVFLWARLFPASTTVSADSVGKPTNSQWTQDYLWAVTLLTAPANVTLSCGSSSQTTRVPAGLTKLKLKLSASCAVKAVVARNATTAVSFAPKGFNFSTRPTAYNFNAFVAASP